MRDRFVDSLKAKNEPVTKEGAPVRKRSFARHLVEALFITDEDKQDKSNGEVPFDDNQRTPQCSDVTPQSKMKAQDDVEMLKDVRQLPPERKISVSMSIMNGLMGIEAATSENLPKNSKETKTWNGMNSSHENLRGIVIRPE